MKRKIIIFVLIGVFATSFLGLTAFSVTRGISVGEKRQEYFDVYLAQAREYVESSPEILDKYGNDISIEFDKTVTYLTEGERSFLDLIIDTFFPRVPDTIEKFALETEKLGFNASINGDEYEIIFTKDLTGKLTVSSFEPVNK